MSRVGLCPDLFLIPRSVNEQETLPEIIIRSKQEAPKSGCMLMRNGRLDVNANCNIRAVLGAESGTAMQGQQLHKNRSTGSQHGGSRGRRRLSGA